MYIKRLTLKNFRCFTDRQFDIDGQFIFVQGKNGIGKTTLLEALHYSCYLRSFRTMQQHDLITFGERHFFIRVDLESRDLDRNAINIGYSKEDGKQVKFNAQPIQTHKELSEQIRIISLTAEDIELVSGYPEKRRHFLNQALMLQDHSHVQLTKKYQAILEQRNGKLFNLRKQNRPMDDELLVWTESLWRETMIIQEKSIAILIVLEQQVNNFLATHFAGSEKDLSITLEYQAKNTKPNQSFNDFIINYKKDLVFSELATGRCAFGVHLNDIIISFNKSRARTFASRGQQKLVTFLLKIAQMHLILKNDRAAILLLDDFLTDFDHTRIQECLALLITLPCQIIITNPIMFDFKNSLIPSSKISFIEL